MEVVWIILAIAVVVYLGQAMGGSPGSTGKRPSGKPVVRPNPSYIGAKGRFDPATARPAGEGRRITGRAHVIDGDSLVISRTQVRLFGIDAPELNHPYGQKAKWAMVALCRGQQVEAEIVETDHHGRTVARCRLADGRDLSAEMVRQALALDWPKFSGGIYRHLEPPGVRRKLWLADARQKGRMDLWYGYESRLGARHPADRG